MRGEGWDDGGRIVVGVAVLETGGWVVVLIGEIVLGDIGSVYIILRDAGCLVVVLYLLPRPMLLVVYSDILLDHRRLSLLCSGLITRNRLSATRRG